MIFFGRPDEYKPTQFELWLGGTLKRAFAAALGKAGIYPVYAMVEPLRKAVDEDNGAEVARTLKLCPKAAHAEIDVLCKDPLRYALSKEKFAAADALLEACPTLLGEGDNAGKSALLYFAYQGSGDDAEALRILQWLVERKADIRDLDKNGWSVLHQAAWRPAKTVAEYLADKGADVNARDIKGLTPLMIAVRYGNTDTMAMLLDRGANMHAMQVDGSNAVIEAMRWSRFDSALWLMARGAKVNFALPGLEELLPKEQPARDGNAAFMTVYEEQRKAWDDDRSAAETEDAVRGIEDGVDKSVPVNHALKLKTGLGKFRKG